MIATVSNKELATALGKTSAALSYRKAKNWEDYRLLLIGYYIENYCDELDVLRMLAGHASMPSKEPPVSYSNGKVGRPRHPDTPAGVAGLTLRTFKPKVSGVSDEQ